MTTARIEIPPKLIPVFVDRPGEIVRWRGSYGGRGSAKTRTFATMTAVKGYEFGRAGREGIILCAREFMNSLDESSMEEIKAGIKAHDWLSDYYEIGEKYIRSKDGRIRYAFAGLSRNVDSIKSKSRILLSWVDEAEGVRETSWRKLIPTVREDDSEIWATWNPEASDSPTHLRLRANPPANAKIVEMNWRDNPWFPDVLEMERLEDQEKRPDTYEHIWEGDFNVILEGAYYGRQMRNARRDGRLRSVPIERKHPVYTSWDLGKAINNPIWCFQVIAGQPRIVDFYLPETEDIRDWITWLNGKGYTGTDYVPHDIMVSEWGSGRTRSETLRALGRKVSRIPMVSVADGLQAARETIDEAVFHTGDDERGERVARGVAGLEQYRRDWDEDLKTFKPQPVKDWAEHIGSAFRYLGLSWKDAPKLEAPKPKPTELEYVANPRGGATANMSVRDAVAAMQRRKRNG